MMDNKFSRRDMLKASLATLGVGIPLVLSGHVEASETSQINNKKSALKTASHISGQIVDEKNQPVPNACVQIWQTKANSNAHPKDVDCDYWEKTTTNAEGSYHIATFLPKCLGQNQPQVHLKISAPGYDDLKLYVCSSSSGKLSFYSAIPERTTELKQANLAFNIMLNKIIV